MKRSSAIDYLKFLFSIIIFLYHYGLIFEGGYIVVEGFFMISGYLMFRSLQKENARDELPDMTARFVFNKYKTLFLPLLFSAISGLLIYDLLVYPIPLSETLRDVPLLTFEVFPLQCAGFKARYTTGVSWYISAMLIATAILHPFMRKSPKKVAYTVCPTLSILIYGFLRATFGHLGVTSVWALDLFNSGLLRAIAGLSAGFLLGALLQRVEGWEPPMRYKLLLSALEFLGLVGLILAMSDETLAYGPYDLVLMVLQFGILWIALSGKAWHTRYISGKYTKFLSDASLYLFLNHVAWCAYFDQNYPSVEEKIQALPWAILFVASSCLIVWTLTSLTFLLKKKSKQKKTL